MPFKSQAQRRKFAELLVKGEISKETYDIVMAHAEELDSAIIYDKDFNYNYFGFKTMERSYLLRINGKVAERPQHMIMRVAVTVSSWPDLASPKSRTLMPDLAIMRLPGLRSR